MVLNVLCLPFGINDVVPENPGGLVAMQNIKPVRVWRLQLVCHTHRATGIVTPILVDTH